MKIKDVIGIDYPGMRPSTTMKFIAGCVACILFMLLIAMVAMFFMIVIKLPVTLIFVAIILFFGFLAANDII